MMMPTIILMDIEYKDGKITDADFITKLKMNEENCPHIVFLSEKNDIKIRLATDRLGVRHFFSKPLNINELSQTLSSLSNKANTNTYQILIVDDDEDFLEYHALAGEKIPLVGRITALADVFDALTSERPYKKAWSVDIATDN